MIGTIRPLSWAVLLLCVVGAPAVWAGVHETGADMRKFEMTEGKAAWVLAQQGGGR